MAMAVAPRNPDAIGDSGAAQGKGIEEPVDVDAVFFVQIQYRGSSYEVPVQPEDGVASIFDFIQDALDFPRENCKLILKGKMIRPDTDNISVAEAGLKAGSKVMLVASSAHDVSFVQNSRADPLVKGFAEEERDEAARRKRARAAAASAWGTKQDSQYRFNSMKAEFKYNTPTPFEAEKLLQRLATDPGIIDIMTSRKFTVGILTEMSPAEAADRMSKRGTPNMDLLGYNQNAGEMIVLKLRTDNTKGFRPYHDLINTLIHELTHNVWGPHDHNFWKLYGELKAQYMRFHRFWSHNGKSADGSGKQFEGFAGTGDDDDGAGEAAPTSFGQVLGAGGGGAGGGAETPRSRAARAAEARRAMGDGPDDPPKPNFLNGDGTWVFLCPCGQVHDPADCPIAQAQQNKGNGDDDDDDDDAMENEDEECEDAEDQKPNKENAYQKSSNTGACAIAAENNVPTPMEVDENGPPNLNCASDTSKAAIVLDETAGGSSSSEAAPVPVEVAVPVAEGNVQQEEERSAATATAAAIATDIVSASLQDTPRSGDHSAAASSQAPAPTSPTPPPPDVMDLDLADLQAQGLDGASVWIANFSAKLNALRGGALDTGLLLRLVQNILKSPSEQKFRRIRADNPKIRAGLLSGGAQAETLISMLGFETIVETDGTKTFNLRDAALDAVKLQLGKEILEQELLGREERQKV